MTHLATQVIRDEHASVAAVLRSLMMMIDQGPGDRPERFFDVLRAMLFYIDEFPERLHHRKEDQWLFPRVRMRCPELGATLDRLERDHVQGESAIRELEHTLLAFEVLGEPRREAFERAAKSYVESYLRHMAVEENEVLPAAQRALNPADWAAIDTAFAANRDPLTGHVPEDEFVPLFSRIVNRAPAPIGLG